MQSAMFFAVREFTCRRELECNYVYPCQVSSQAGNDVILKLDDTTVRFAKGKGSKLVFWRMKTCDYTLPNFLRDVRHSCAKGYTNRFSKQWAC